MQNFNLVDYGKYANNSLLIANKGNLTSLIKPLPYILLAKNNPQLSQFILSKIPSTLQNQVVEQCHILPANERAIEFLDEHNIIQSVIVEDENNDDIATQNVANISRLITGFNNISSDNYNFCEQNLDAVKNWSSNKLIYVLKYCKDNLDLQTALGWGNNFFSVGSNIACDYIVSLYAEPNTKIEDKVRINQAINNQEITAVTAKEFYRDLFIEHKCTALGIEFTEQNRASLNGIGSDEVFQIFMEAYTNNIDEQRRFMSHILANMDGFLNIFSTQTLKFLLSLSTQENINTVIDFCSRFSGHLARLPLENFKICIKPFINNNQHQINILEELLQHSRSHNTNYMLNICSNTKLLKYLLSLATSQERTDVVRQFLSSFIHFLHHIPLDNFKLCIQAFLQQKDSQISILNFLRESSQLNNNLIGRICGLSEFTFQYILSLCDTQNNVDAIKEILKNLAPNLEKSGINIDTLPRLRLILPAFINQNNTQISFINDEYHRIHLIKPKDLEYILSLCTTHDDIHAMENILNLFLDNQRVGLCNSEVVKLVFPLFMQDTEQLKIDAINHIAPNIWNIDVEKLDYILSLCTSRASTEIVKKIPPRIYEFSLAHLEIILPVFINDEKLKIEFINYLIDRCKSHGNLTVCVDPLKLDYLLSLIRVMPTITRGNRSEVNALQNTISPLVPFINHLPLEKLQFICKAFIDNDTYLIDAINKIIASDKIEFLYNTDPAVFEVLLYYPSMISEEYKAYINFLKDTGLINLQGRVGNDINTRLLLDLYSQYKEVIDRFVTENFKIDNGSFPTAAFLKLAFEVSSGNEEAMNFIFNCINTLASNLYADLDSHSSSFAYLILQNLLLTYANGTESARAFIQALTQKYENKDYKYLSQFRIFTADGESKHETDGLFQMLNNPSMSQQLVVTLESGEVSKEIK